MKVMVIGARGMLGTDLIQVFAGMAPFGLDLPEFNMTDRKQCLDRALGFAPEVIIDAAALTNVDYCETHEEEALLVNGQGTGNLAEAANKAGALLVYYSTDYVFDGRKNGGYLEDDPTNPVSIYGKSKLSGEEFVRSLCPKHLILRTSWLFGCHGKNFIRTIVGLARQGQQLRVVNDQQGSPTYSLDLAERTLTMLEAGCHGTYHVTNRGSCTWYELARRSLEWASVPGASIEPVSTVEFPRPAPRPACSVLVNARMESEGFEPMRSWEEAARAYVTSCLSGS